MYQVCDGYRQYDFTNIEDANQKFLDILRAKLLRFVKQDLDIDYFDIGAWMFYDKQYIIPSNLMNFLKTYHLDIFNHVDKYNLQDTIMGMRIASDAKVYKDISQANDRQNDSRANSKDAE